MSTTTTNYKLIKPALTDSADITAMNPNWDTIDAELKKKYDPNNKPTAADVGAVSGVWKMYRLVSDLGLTEAEATMENIYSKMPDYSILICPVNGTWTSGVTPVLYGNLCVVKEYSARGYAEFTDVQCARHIGTYSNSGNGVFGGWKQFPTTDYALPRDGSAAMTGALSIVDNTNTQMLLERGSVNPVRIQFRNKTGTLGYFGHSANSYDGLVRWLNDGTTTYTILDTGNSNKTALVDTETTPTVNNTINWTYK